MAPRVTIHSATGRNENGDEQTLRMNSGACVVIELRDGRIVVPSEPERQLFDESPDRYVVSKARPADADRSLPEKGTVRREEGHRVGRDGRRVHREAEYDPYSDVARERVVDAETGDVIIDKVESMREKYEARGRWRP